MSWSHCSRPALAVAVVVCLFAAVGVAGAVTVVSEDVPEEAEVDTSVTATVELEDLYENESVWQLEGTTGLDDATWTVETYRQGEQLDTIEESGTRIILDEWEESDRDSPTRVVVEISGEVPPIEDYSYEEQETIQILGLVEVFDDGMDSWLIGDWRVPHTSQAATDARQAIESAEQTVEDERDAGTDVSQAESTLEDAITAYDDGDLDDAASLADDATDQAEEGASTNEDEDSTGDSDESGDDETDGAESDGGEADESGSAGSESDDESANDGDEGSDANDDTDESGDDGAGEADDGSDDDGGGLLSIVLGVVVLGLLAGGGFWYYQQQQGPSRDPLG